MIKPLTLERLKKLGTVRQIMKAFVVRIGKACFVGILTAVWVFVFHLLLFIRPFILGICNVISLICAAALIIAYFFYPEMTHGPVSLIAVKVPAVYLVISILVAAFYDIILQAISPYEEVYLMR